MAAVYTCTVGGSLVVARGGCYMCTRRVTRWASVAGSPRLVAVAAVYMHRRQRLGLARTVGGSLVVVVVVAAQPLLEAAAVWCAGGGCGGCQWAVQPLGTH